MFTFVIFALAVFGLANAVAVLHFGAPIRALTGRIPVICTLFRCPACLSFWIGLSFSFLAFSPTQLAAPTSLEPWKCAMLDGMACSAVSFMIHTVMERLDPTEETT